MICKSVTNNHKLTEDLVSEVCITVLKLDNELLNDILNRNKLESYIYGVANIMFWRSKSSFYVKYRGEHLELFEETLADDTQEPFDVKEYLIDLGLDANEKLWIETCLEFNFNYSLVHKKTGISRRKISERIKAIEYKYKK